MEIFREFEDPAYLSLTEDDFEKYNELPPRTISQQFSAETIKAIESGLFKDWGVWSFIVQDCPSIKEPFLLLSFINEYCRLFKYNSEDKKSISEDYLFTPLSKLKPNDSNRTLIKKLIEQQKKEKTSDYWKEYFIKCLNRILKNWEDD